MNDEIELISDGDGVAVIGDAQAVERFLASEGLMRQSRPLPPMGRFLAAGGTSAQVAADVANNSGRWVKLTKESAQAVSKHGVRTSSKSGLSTGVIKGSKGQIKGFVEFAKTPGSIGANPALLSGAAGMMAQLAMQQAMDEITDYLATIDAKLDDVLRAQKDSVLARMIGVGLVIEESMTIRNSRGRVDETTWSKVQTVPSTIAETQAYALRQLDALAEKLEKDTRLGGLEDAVDEAREKTHEWLAVLARCFQLQDGIAVLELDRVRDASPDEVDAHRVGLRQARDNRLDLIAGATSGLLGRLEAAAARANSKVLFNPVQSPAIVRSSHAVVQQVADFRELLGLESTGVTVDARRWTSAANDVKSKARETGSRGAHAVKRAGGEGVGRARSLAGKVSQRVSASAQRVRPGKDQSAEGSLDDESEGQR